MTETRPTTKVRVETNESLPDLLDRLRSIPAGEVTLEVPEHCPLLLTATEFRALTDTAKQQDLTLSVETEDRLRRQLAMMFGLPTTSEPEVVAAATEAGRRPVSPGGFSLGGWRRARRETTAADHAAVGNGLAEEDPIAVSRRRRTSVYEPSFVGQRRESKVGAAEHLDGTGALDYLNGDTARGLGARTLGSIVAIAGLVVLAGVIASWYFLPGVSVGVTLEQRPVQTNLIYTVAAPGAQIPSDASFAVEASEGEAEVSFTYSIPATGVRRDPDQTATGAVELRNPGGEAVTVASGTELRTLAGGTYVTTEEVEVPAAKDGAPGQAEVPVRAAEPGTAGNLPQGYLTGKLEEQNIFYSNRAAAIEGGTDRETPLVSEGDLAAIREEAEAKLRQLTADAWSEQLPEGQALVETSVVAESPELAVEQEAGTEAETVTLNGTVQATGLLYSLADVQAQARQPVEERLAAQVPDGYALDAEAVVLGEPEELAKAPDSIQYEVSAAGVARAVFTEEEQERLAASLVGLSPEQAEATALAHPAVAAVDIAYSPGWWFERMPRLESRIAIDVREGAPPLPDFADGTPQPEDLGLRTKDLVVVSKSLVLSPKSFS